MRTKFRLTTIEEDFQDIGLIQKPTTEEVEASVSEDEEDEDDEEEDEGDAVSEALKLRRRPKKSAALRKALKLARRKYYKQHKGQEMVRARKYAKSSRGKKKAKIRLSYWKKHAGMAGKPNMRLGSGMDYVANMVEEVGGILDTIGQRQNREFVKGYANIALIADTMSRGFDALGEELQEEELVALGVRFAELAEQSAEIAEALEAEEIELDEELEVAFKGDMDDLLSGLEIYADLTEADDPEEADSVEEKEEDDGSEEDEVEDEDESGN